MTLADAIGDAIRWQEAAIKAAGKLEAAEARRQKDIDFAIELSQIRIRELTEEVDSLRRELAACEDLLTPKSTGEEEA